MTLEYFKEKRKEVIEELIDSSIGLEYLDINDRTSAIIGSDFAILFQFGRGVTDITYLTEDKENIIIEYPFNNFIVSSFDSNDREGIIQENGLYENTLTDLKILIRGLNNHWKNILVGSKEWILQYGKSKYYYEPAPAKLSEGKVIQEILCNRRHVDKLNSGLDITQS